MEGRCHKRTAICAEGLSSSASILVLLHHHQKWCGDSGKFLEPGAVVIAISTFSLLSQNLSIWVLGF